MGRTSRVRQLPKLFTRKFTFECEFLRVHHHFSIDGKKGVLQITTNMPVMVKDEGVLFARASLNVAMMAWMEVATVKGDKDRPESLPRNICAAAIHDAEVGHFGLEIASKSDLACPDSPFTMHFLS